MKSPLIPVSWGELIDKLTILEIKQKHILDERARSNISRELCLLSDIAVPVVANEPKIGALQVDLAEINQNLWKVEDEIRELERLNDFGPKFIGLARSVYRLNDARADLKKCIDLELGSEISEEKSYGDYAP